MKKVCFISLLLLVSANAAQVHYDPGQSRIQPSPSVLETAKITGQPFPGLTSSCNPFDMFSSQSVLRSSPMLQSLGASGPEVGVQPVISHLAGGSAPTQAAPPPPLGAEARGQLPLGSASTLVMQVNALRRENADLNENLARAIATIDALNQALEEMRRSSEEHLAATTSKNLAEITRLNDTIRNHQQTRDQLELDLQSQLFQVQRLRAQVAEKDGLERRCKDYQVKVDELEYRDARNALEISKLRGFVPEANAGASTVASLRAENEALQKRNESLTMQLATARTQYDALMGQLQFASGTATGK